MTSVVKKVSSDIYCYWNSFLTSKMQLEKIFSIYWGKEKRHCTSKESKSFRSKYKYFDF